MLENKKFIKIQGAKEQNLKNISLSVPLDSIVVFTGVSGSGKSSIAFDTIYAEGRRLYLESLSNYAKHFELKNKPEVDSISGLIPSIAIDQKTTSKSRRSTVATMTEIYDYMRMLFARVGKPYSPATGLQIIKRTYREIIKQISNLPLGTKIQISTTILNTRDIRRLIPSIRRKGYDAIKIDGKEYSISEMPILKKDDTYKLEVILGTISINPVAQEADNSASAIVGHKTAVNSDDAAPDDAASTTNPCINSSETSHISANTEICSTANTNNIQVQAFTASPKYEKSLNEMVKDALDISNGVIDITVLKVPDNSIHSDANNIETSLPPPILSRKTSAWTKIFNVRELYMPRIRILCIKNRTTSILI